MKRFRNILFVSNGVKNETEALAEAIRLAEHDQACLGMLIVCPPFSSDFEQYKASYEAFLKEKAQKTIAEAQANLTVNKKSITVNVAWEKTPSIAIIQHVLRQSHDLVIKAAEDDGGKGFKALDMALLRKCPCTLFLHRPLKNPKAVQVAVAIAPENAETSEQELACNLLKLAQHLTTFYLGKFSILSCWEFALEGFLRNSAWVDMSAEAIDEMVQQEGNSNYIALHQLIQQTKLQENPTIYHLKGDPTEIIPTWVTEKQIDVLVMGTVARTGITGFIIGNTAENILQKLDCSLWAMKPQGFVSPVKAY
ncbi:MAG: universal stress protein [Legionella sp.]|uniref:universal stress protein n=1 Tax=Legionella sp. TaxID=459 RepID=UPI00285151DE|nr:universal stress protein [Legionella sp.]